LLFDFMTMNHLSEKTCSLSNPGRPSSVHQAVILAGGLGTRLHPLTANLPKPMVQLNGKPFAEYLVEMLTNQGIRDILFLLGYLPDPLIKHFGDGSRFGATIRTSLCSPQSETGTRLREALPLLDPEFLLMYCDNYWPLALHRMENEWRGSGLEAMLTIYANDDRITRDNVRISSDGKIVLYDKSRTAPDLAGVDIGFGFFRRSHVESLPKGNISFERSVYPDLVSRGQLAAYVSGHRYYSIGSIERLEATARFLEFRPAILLDRDGVLNEKAPRGEYVCSPEDFRWLPAARESLARLTAAGFRIFVITNQAGIARGALTLDDLAAVNQKMTQEAANAGGRIDGVYFCPHGWHDGCACRKPKPGLLFQAQRDHALDLSRTWFLGDDERDLEAGYAAGCPSGLVTPMVPLDLWVSRVLSSMPNFHSPPETRSGEPFTQHSHHDS